MNDEPVFSMAMFKDGTVEVKYAVEGSLKIYKLKPRNPVLMLLPLFSTLCLAIGSDLLLKQQIKTLAQKMATKRPNETEGDVIPEGILGDP